MLSLDNKGVKNCDDLVAKIRHWLDDATAEDLDLGDVDGENLASAIKNIFRQAPAAGGVVIIDNKFVAIERNGIPDLPKGHIEKGESPEVAALREVEEETGITDLEIIQELPATWHCYLLNDQWTIKKTSWYLMKTASGMKNIPQTEEGITKVYLVDKEGVNEFEKNTFDSLKTLVPKIILAL
ncbi:MAG: NUDIX domain-containing protein [Bacteroidales bacterium]|nr:NUDIX domain-containing protein [Bacteroidales bacterium]